MKWISIDPATTSGVANWDNDTLVNTVVVKPRGTSGKWYRGSEIHASRFLAWLHTYDHTDAKLGGLPVVIERGFGGMATAVRAQGMQIGWHQCMCALLQRSAPIEVNVAEWRRVIKEDLQVSWPKDSKRAKQLSIQLVHKVYGITVTEDEADAVLLGRAAIRMGLVPQGEPK